MSGFFDAIADSWCSIAGVPTGFRPGAVTVMTAERSRTSPPGWYGAVRLGDSAMITAPTDALAERVRKLVAGLEPAQICDPPAIFADEAAAAILGPATLAYLDAPLFRPTKHDVVEASVMGADIEALELAAGDHDADEASVSDVTSPVFVTRTEDGAVTAACGYRTWVSMAHMGVLTHPDHRGRGLATAVGSAATAYAIDAGLVPQWRARVAASRAVARRLGYVHLGDQLSFQLSDSR